MNTSSKGEPRILKNGFSIVVHHQEESRIEDPEEEESRIIIKDPSSNAIKKQNQQDQVSISVENLPKTFLTVVTTSGDHPPSLLLSRSYNELTTVINNQNRNYRSSSRSLSPNNNTISMDDAVLANRLAFSRSFTDRYQLPSAVVVGAGRKSSSTMLDTKHIRIYMKRQNSRGSINSAASVGLGDAFGSSSRPVSAESTSGTEAFSANIQTRSPRLIPSLSRESCHVMNNGGGVAKSAPGGIPRSSSIPAGLRARPLASSFAELVCRPAPYLYMGGIEAANNANLLCRLNIESIVDVSNIERTKLPREKRSDCPCLCRLETAHCRSFFTAYIEENNSSDLITTFEDVNEFIEKARLCGKSVLVHSYYGRNRCAVFVVQHLIKSQQMPLYRAVQIVKNLWPMVNITENFNRSLKRWEGQCLGGGVDDDFSSGAASSMSSGMFSVAMNEQQHQQQSLRNNPASSLTTRTSLSSIIPASRRSAWM